MVFHCWSDGWCFYLTIKPCLLHQILGCHTCSLRSFVALHVYKWNVKHCCRNPPISTYTHSIHPVNSNRACFLFLVMELITIFQNTIISKVFPSHIYVIILKYFQRIIKIYSSLSVIVMFIWLLANLHWCTNLANFLWLTLTNCYIMFPQPWNSRVALIVTLIPGISTQEGIPSVRHLTASGGTWDPPKSRLQWIDSLWIYDNLP